MTSKTHADATDGTECAECANGLRNRFFRGKQMKAEEFQAEQAYFIRRRRLVNRGVLGWGVVYGLALDGPRPPAASPGHQDGAPATPAPPATIKVGPGFALDRHGREIVLTQQTLLGVDNAFGLQRDSSGCSMQKLDKLAAGRYLLRIHYAERTLGDANLPEGCGCAKAEKRFVCETVLFSLEPICGECPCAEGRCKSECGCGPDGCCAAGRGPHACLCQWVTKAMPAEEPAHLTAWHGAWLDAGDGVALACVTIARTDDRCVPVAFTSIDDDCSPRRLVKGNDLLYDLMRGCDLTRIESISWSAWHRESKQMPWPTFLELMNAVVPPARGSKENVVTKLSIRFSGPVDTATLTGDCFALRFIVRSADTGWREVRPVPITQIVFEPPVAADPPGNTRGVTLCVAPKWVNEVSNGPNVFRDEEGAIVEVEVFGDYILDCHGQAIDANAHGFTLSDARPGESGNGAPGGTFRSVFRIERCSD